MSDRIRVLYVARAFPPTLGGMEMLAHQLSKSLSKHVELRLLVNRSGKIALPLFSLYVLIVTTWLARRGRIDVVLLGDALLAPLGRVLRITAGVPVAASVCGLDVTYPNRAYQFAVPSSVARLDMTMPISKATETEVLARCGASTPTIVIPLGVNPLPVPDERAVAEFKAQAGVNGGAVLLTAGRLIRRKGVAWFVTHVLPRLPEGTTYMIVGEGDQADVVRAAATRAAVAERVRLLGRVSDEILALAYHAADIFVMPNVRVNGDMEGFGLVALEAAVAGLPVVASRLDGITEAVHDGRNGLLVTPEAPEEYVTVLRDLVER
ncbi:MAG: glycosyltransferase family 4 protein, partial [Chloroflexi bacterium]|nr:glycosyltransferase family 4 protein [Chloroflexota bacterium]